MRYFPAAIFIVLLAISGFSDCKNTLNMDRVELSRQVSRLSKKNFGYVSIVHEKEMLQGSDFLSKSKIKIHADNVSNGYYDDTVDFSSTSIRLLNDWTLNFEIKEKSKGDKMKIKIDRPRQPHILPALSPSNNVSSEGDYNITFVFEEETGIRIVKMPYSPLWTRDLIVDQQMLEGFIMGGRTLENEYSFYHKGLYFYFETTSSNVVSLLCFHESVPLAEFAQSTTRYSSSSRNSSSGRFYFLSYAGTKGESTKTLDIPEEIASRFGLPASVELSARRSIKDGFSVQQVLAALAASLVACVAFAML